ncbi:hypothetical protein [Flavobacterium sp.]|uniref:hypothetical protein n=1 Tax=Flavobacterium sp. TaxID=239 RepID=UPI00404822A2
MKKFLTCVLFFFISQLYSQNIGYSLNVDHLFLADESKSSNDDNRKIKLKFTSLDNGKYFVFNRLLYGNKTGKVLAYFKPFNTVVIRSQDHLTYMTFKEAFPKGGFYKTNITKPMFGQPTTLYSFDNDVVDIQLWVGTGARTGSGFERYLNDMGLLQNLPANAAIIAVSIMGIEVELSQFKEDSYSNAKSNLNDILISFNEPKEALLECIKESHQNETPLSSNGEKMDIVFEYKITSKISQTDSKGKLLYEANTTLYANKDNSVTLQIFEQPNTDGISFIYINKNLNQEIEGSYNENQLYIERGKRVDSQNCLFLKEKLLSKKSNVSQFMAGYEHEFGLFLIEKNTIDYPNFQNQTTSNGFISKRIYLNKDLEIQEYNSEVELGVYRFNLEK